MHHHDKNMKQGDRLLKMPGKLDRGPIEFKTRMAEHEGEIMAIATRAVITASPTTTIMGAVEKMTECGFRRLPVADPGSRRLLGILTSSDIINFMGGGDKFNLVRVKHGGNLIQAVNESVRTIMTPHLTTLPSSSTINDAIAIITQKMVGGIPLLGPESQLEGIVTERDVMGVLASQKSSRKVEDVMSTSLRVTEPDSPIGKVTRDMTSHRFRRLPVVSGDVVFGIVTSTDIMKYLGSKKVFDRLVTGDVEEVMDLPIRTLVSGSLITITPDKTLNDAARMMQEKGVGALPVIENARLIGLITEFDLVKALSEE
jgi:CBS domain-containing protein